MGESTMYNIKTTLVKTVLALFLYVSLNVFL